MADMQRRSRRDAPATYWIRVDGLLDPTWSEMLRDMVVVSVGDNGGAGATLLTGMLPDQAALMGVLSQLVDLGLVLASLERLDEGPAASA